MASGQADELRGLLQRVFRRFGAMAAETTPCGQPLSMAHAHALMALLANEQLSQQELGRELGIDKSNVARLCARMVDAEHVVQRPSETDGRSRLVSLTARGRKLAIGVEASSKARFGALLEGIAPHARTHVLSGLRQLVVAIEQLPPMPSPDERSSR